MKNTYNVEAANKEEKVQKGPEWAEKAVGEMWDRIIAKSEEEHITFSYIASKHNFSASSVYNTITKYKAGEPIRDTEIRVIEAIATELHTPLNYFVHGEIIEPEQKDTSEMNKTLVDNIFSIAKGNRLTMFLAVFPYLKEEELKAVKSDIITRFA